MGKLQFELGNWMLKSMLLTPLQYCSPKGGFQRETAHSKESSLHRIGWGVKAGKNMLLQRNQTKCSNIRNLMHTRKGSEPKGGGCDLPSDGEEGSVFQADSLEGQQLV